MPRRTIRLLVCSGLLFCLLSVGCMGCANSTSSTLTLEQLQQRLNAEHFQQVERWNRASGD